MSSGWKQTSLESAKIRNGVLHRFKRRKALTGIKVCLVQEWAKLNSPVAWHDHKLGSDAVFAIWGPAVIGSG
jgi:hypothetical protein